MLIALERIAANEFRKPVGLMRIRGADGAHFMQDDVDAALGQLPCGFGAGQSAAGD